MKLIVICERAEKYVLNYIQPQRNMSMLRVSIDTDSWCVHENCVEFITGYSGRGIVLWQLIESVLKRIREIVNGFKPTLQKLGC